MTHRYIPRGGLDTMPGPWSCHGARIHLFLLPADRSALQRLCDRCLNDPSGGALGFVPDLDWVIVSFQAITAVSSEAVGEGIGGRFGQREAAVWVRVRDENDPGSGAMALVPYIFTDNPVLVAAGREVYGFPKELGDVTLAPQSGNFHVRALALDSARGVATKQDIITCRAVSSTPRPRALADVQMTTAGIVDELIGPGGILPAPGGVFGLVLDLLRNELRFVFLKEFRTVADSADSDFVAVTAATQTTRSVHDVGFDLETYVLGFPALHSHTIAEDLGLALDANRQIEATVSGSVEIDFRISDGRTLWP